VSYGGAEGYGTIFAMRGLANTPFFSDADAAAHGGVPAEVVSLARAGNAIAAIKLYRELTGAGLREAKDIVDSP